MTLFVNDIFAPLDFSLEEVYNLAIKTSGVSKSNIKNIYTRKKSVDARFGEVKFVYSVCIELIKEERVKLSPKVTFADNIVNFKIDKVNIPSQRPIIVGFGPAGIFCAYLLALYGANPIIFEMGKSVDERKKDVDNFFKNGVFNEKSNVQFGEGGAGTFSDGKLTTRIKDERCRFVIETFHKFGADDSILYEAHPHIGTDCLGTIIKNIREFIVNNGGEVHFSREVRDILVENGCVKGVVLDNNEKVYSDKVVLAVGHSSRGIFDMLYRKNIPMEKKPFSVGFRIEHKKEFIDEGRYGKYAGHKNLSAAEYQFSYRKGERGCYTFCMCPGGQVIASNSEKNSVVTNGMSKSDRNDKNSNSAIVASVLPKDLDTDIMSGVNFQRELEKKAFEYGGRNYSAPVQLCKDYLNNEKSTHFEEVLPSYPVGTEFCNFNELMPQKVNHMLIEGLDNFDKKIKNFSRGNAVLTGIETRTSSPLRVLRGKNYNSIGVDGLYPAGEGAGYAGGITSAAVDGIRIAQAILENE